MSFTIAGIVGSLGLLVWSGFSQGFFQGMGQLISRPIMDYVQASGYFDIDTYSVIDQYCVDLTEEAKEGKLSGVVGRDKEIDEIMSILTKKGRGNPCLIGRAGVGKTALVKGLAVKIAKGEVPENFKNKRILNVKMVDLVQGKSYNNGAGAMNRIRALFDYAIKNPDVVLFIDEIHQVSGVAELCKTYLDGNKVHLMGATTLTEYNSSIGKDPALARRFTNVLIDQTSPEVTEDILRDMRISMEKDNNVSISDEAIQATVELTGRYMKHSSYPDKAIHTLERAIEKLALSKNNEEHSDKKAVITPEHIHQAISDAIHFKVGEIDDEELVKLATVDLRIRQYVSGQDEAVKEVADSLRKGRVDFRDPNRPIASFMFTGLSGVGKTYLAQVLGQEVGSLVSLDMSQYARDYSIMDLVGSKSQGFKGELTERILEKPYSVVLLDGIEKAHPDVRSTLLNVIETGFLTDSSGAKVDFRNTVIIMTSNIGKEKIENAPENVDVKQEVKQEVYEKFGSELANRLDNIIVFNRLTRGSLQEITGTIIDSFACLLNTSHINLDVSEDVLNYLVDIAVKQNSGARGVRKAIQDNLQKEITNLVLFGKVKPGQTINIGLENNQFVLNVK